MEFAFKDLKVWQKSIEFGREVILCIEKFDSDRKHFRIIEQIEASVTSVSSNIAEGKGRNSKKEFMQYLYIARGSLYECISQLNICAQMGWIPKEVLTNLEDQGKEIAKMLKGLINSLK